MYRTLYKTPEVAMTTKYQELQRRVRQLQASGELPKTLSKEEQIDWAYGNTVIENADITLDMVKTAYSTKHPNE
jgi:hypothetical protein